MQAIDRIELPLLDGGRSSTPSDLRPSLATTLYHKKLQMFLSATKGRCPVDRELRPYERSRWAEHGRSCSVVEVCPPHRGQSWSHHLRSRATLRDGARAKGRAWEDGEHHGAAPDVSIIEAGAPAFGCTVHPLRLQAPPPLTRTRAPARAIVQRHPVGQEEGTVGRASRARLSTPRPLTPLLSGTCLTSSGRPPLREMLATKGPGHPEGYPGPGCTLLYALASLRALAAEVQCKLLCLLARLGIDHDLAYADPAVVAGVGVLDLIVILSGWVRVWCARLLCGHEVPLRGPGPGRYLAVSPRGHFFIRRHHYTHAYTINLPFNKDLWYYSVSTRRLQRS